MIIEATLAVGAGIIGLAVGSFEGRRAGRAAVSELHLKLSTVRTTLNGWKTAYWELNREHGVLKSAEDMRQAQRIAAAKLGREAKARKRAEAKAAEQALRNERHAEMRAMVGDLV